MAKVLNKKNLLGLGPDRLAELLIEVSKGRADIQRRLRLELSAHAGAEDVARDIRKRYASIRLAKGYLSRKTHRAFAKEIASLISLIEQGVAPSDADLAFELLWELLHLAPSVLRRTKDTSEILTTAFLDVMAAVARIAADVTLPTGSLAEAVFEAVREDRGEIFIGGVGALAASLGEGGLGHLKSLTLAALGTRHGKAARTFADRRLQSLLREIADAEGDVDAYLASFTAAQMAQPEITVDVASRLLDSGRAEEALAVATTSLAQSDNAAVADVFIRSLEMLGRKDDLRDFLWSGFRKRPDADRLRRYLRLLPDFDDIEAEDEAKRLAQEHSDTHAALRFFIEWPDLAAAAALVREKAELLRGSEARIAAHADALEARDPLASVLVRRAIILSLLRTGKVAADRRAAEHLKSCAASDMLIPDYGDFPDHLSFLEKLRRLFRSRKTFWERIA